MNKYIDIFNYIYDLKDKLTDNEFLILNNKIKDLIDENNKLKNISKCNCCYYWKYPNITNESYKLCLESIEKLKRCKNFIKISKDIPQLKNIITKQNIPFIENPIYNSYDKDYILMMIKIFIFLNDCLVYKYHKIIVNLALYDFLIRNINFLIDNEKFSNACIKKFNEYLEDDDFIEVVNEYNINYNKWKEILNETINKNIIF